MKIRNAAALLLIVAGKTYALPSYILTELGNLGGNYSAAYGINELGQIVGTSCISNCNALAPDNKYRATYWASGASSAYNMGFTGVARAINDLGEAVGETGTGWARPQYPDGRAFYWNNTYAAGTYLDLGTHYSDGIGSGTDGRSGAFDITNSGLITGFAYTENSFLSNGSSVSTFSRGFVASRDNGFVLEDMGCVAGNTDCYSRGQGMNESGEIVGRASNGTFNDDKQATYWDWQGEPDVGDLSGDFSPATGMPYSTFEDINEGGLAVGVSATDPSGTDLFATLWRKTANGYESELIDMAAGYNKGYAWAVNDDDEVVGYMLDGTTGTTRRAFINSAEYGTLDLNNLIVGGLAGTGFSYLDIAYDINNKGQIVGVGKVAGAPGYRAFLLTEVVTEVPVPAAAWFMGSALLGLIGLKRRR